MDGIGDRDRPSGLRADECPVCLTVHKQHPVTHPNEFVLSRRADVPEFDAPRPNLNRIAEEGWTKIVDVVRSHDARALYRPLRTCPSRRLEMADRCILHPLNAGDVVDMSVLIERTLRDIETMPEDARDATRTTPALYVPAYGRSDMLRSDQTGSTVPQCQRILTRAPPANRVDIN